MIWSRSGRDKFLRFVIEKVDLIAIDFSEKLPFRLKLPMVKAAIKQGRRWFQMPRSLIANSLRKKQCYKGAIRVERISYGELIDTKEPCKVPKTLKAIDFTSITEGMSSKGMQLKDWVSGSGDKLKPLDSALIKLRNSETDILLLDDTETLLTSTKDIEPSAAFNANPKDSSELDVVSPSKDCDTTTKEILPGTEEQIIQIDLVLAARDVSSNEDFVKTDKYGKHEDDTDPLVDDMPLESYDEIQKDTVLVASDEPQEKLLVEMEERN
ncbi:hypothetical protein HHK36_009384 [Tetracentron sinense]|uniref:Uncharacterized protein n=1 Tax=Tetracentron sinense TaxID=13715 RepID=A0A834ZAT2_TETSI|nr:hypothetical protein HHK36_009384 [Tetracentron sinense]